MKYILAIGIAAVLLFSLAPINTSQAALVPCGATIDDPATKDIDESQPCGFCHVFVLVSNVISFFLVPGGTNGGFAVVPLLGAVLIVIGGFFLMTAGGDPNRLQRGKNVLLATVIGLAIIYGSWSFLNLGLKQFGVVQFQGNFQWWQLECR